MESKYRDGPAGHKKWSVIFCGLTDIQQGEEQMPSKDTCTRTINRTNII